MLTVLTIFSGLVLAVIILVQCAFMLGSVSVQPSPTMLAVLAGRKFAREVILIIRLPIRPSRPKVISMPAVLRNVWATTQPGGQRTRICRPSRDSVRRIFVIHAGLHEVRRLPNPCAPLGHDFTHQASHRIGLDHTDNCGPTVGVIRAHKCTRRPEGCLAGRPPQREIRHARQSLKAMDYAMGTSI
jgi:hypothetical protein